MTFYPKLTETGKQEAASLVRMIVEQVKIGIDDSELYQSIPCYIESDAWTNFRNSIMDGFNDYSNGKAKDLYDFKTVRKVMLAENYDLIIKDLNQDNLEKIKSLEETIRILMSHQRY